MICSCSGFDPVMVAYYSRTRENHAIVGACETVLLDTPRKTKQNNSNGNG